MFNLFELSLIGGLVEDKFLVLLGVFELTQDNFFITEIN